jgi:arylsulfatase A-like enzyme
VTAKKSLLITIKIFFVLFSLQFLNDAFFYWDGYSYYMSFRDFLPGLSFSFVLWSLSSALLAFFFWLITYVSPKIIPGFSRFIRFDRILVWVIFFVSAFFMIFLKRKFIHFSLAEWMGLGHGTLLILGVTAVTVVLWALSRFKYLQYEKILQRVVSSIAPLFWILTVLFFIAVPLSARREKTSLKEKMPAFEMHKSQANMDRPNIILVTMDALSASDMQLYGFDRPTTPFISEWASDAIVFKRAYSSANWTTAACMSIMTGQRPWTHRIWYPAKYHPVNHYPHNFPRVLRDNGYAVYGFVQNEHAHPETLGIQDAFMKKDWVDTFSTRRGLLIDIVENVLQRRNIVSGWIFKHPVFIPFLILQWGNLSKVSRIEPVWNHFIEYISHDAKEPFFAWLHILPPHDPYVPPLSYAGVFGDAEKFDTEQKQESHFGFHQEYEPGQQRDVDLLRKRYDESILYCDQEFERLMSRLAACVDMDRTVIILSSDHGESFSHGFLGHNGKYLYEDLVHIPLIIKIPGRTKGGVIDTPVEQIDIGPTILELAGIPVPAWIEGRSLLPLLDGSSPGTRPIFSMQLQLNRAIGHHPIRKGSIAVWEGDYKLIRYLGSDVPDPQLFNLRADPDESRNLFQEAPRKAEELTDLIDGALFLANKGSSNVSP